MRLKIWTLSCEREVQVISIYTFGGTPNQITSGFLRKLGAWAYLIIDNDKRSYHHGTALKTSNQKMELTAIIEGLKAVEGYYQ